MNFEPNDDQLTFLTFLGQIAGGDRTGWQTSPDKARFDWSDTLDGALEANGFYDAAAEPTLGRSAAAAMIYELAQRPVVVEAAASALLRPLIAADLPRPFAVSTGKGHGAIRFLPRARTLISLQPDGAFAASIGQHSVKTLNSIFAYPMGRVSGSLDWQRLDADPSEALDLWRVAIAAEIAGSLQAGLDAVIAHVSERRQFGRPLGSFQGVQHRLATSAMLIQSARWLALKAAGTGNPVDASIALGHAQLITRQVTYDLHQFMGAMGLTLEHPLHRFTYRAKFLQSSLGGADAQFCLVADHLWGEA